MNELQIFNNDEFGQIRTIEKEESEIWFAARKDSNISSTSSWEG